MSQLSGPPTRTHPCRNQSHPQSGSRCSSEVLQELSTAQLIPGAALGSTDLPRGTFPHIQGPGIPFPLLFPPCVGDEKGCSVGPCFLSFAWPALLRSAPSRWSKAHSAAPAAPSQQLAEVLVPCPGCAAPEHAFQRGNLPSLGEKNECWCPWEPRAPAVDRRWSRLALSLPAATALSPLRQKALLRNF